MINLQRLRPARTTLAVVVGLLWAISFGALRDFVWADLRGGLMDLRGLGRTTRALAWLGFGLLAAMIVALVFNDVWRAQFPFIAVRSETDAGRGALLPIALVPVSLFLFAMAWSFMLTGALHSHPVIRLGALLLYVSTAISMTSTAISDLSGRPLLGWTAVGAIGLVPLIFAARWRAAPRPAPEFVLFLVPVALTLALAQLQGVTSWRLNNVPIMFFSLSLNLGAAQQFVLPLLFLIGVDIANFTQQAAGWTTAILAARLPRWLTPTALLLFLAWRLRDVVAEAIARVDLNGWRTEAAVYCVAALVPLGTGVSWWLIKRLSKRADEERVTAPAINEVVERWALPLILVYNATALLNALLLSIAACLPTLGRLVGDFALGTSLSNQVIDVTSEVFNATFVPWRFLIDGSAVLLALWLARRGRGALALYLALFGLLDIRSELLAPGMPLARFTAIGPGNPLDFWWVAIFGAVTLFWLFRGRLTATRAAGMLFLTLITGLLRQTDFIENPFSPFFGFAGIFFIAFGIVWDVLTSGSWANEGTKALPRSGRIFLYLGYVLLTVTLVNWAVTIHDLTTISSFTGDIAVTGLLRFGRPLLFAIFAVTLAALTRNEAIPALKTE